MTEGKVPLFPGACPDRLKELEAYTDIGDATDEFLIHLDQCPACAAAADAVFRQEAEALQELSKSIREDEEKRQQERKLIASRFLRFFFGKRR